MLGFLMLLIFLLPLAYFTLTSTKKLVFYILLIGGIPLTTFMPNLVLLEFLGGLSPQAAFLFFIVGALFFVLIFSNGLVFSEFNRFNLYSFFLIYVIASMLWSDDFIYGLRFSVKLLTPFLLYIAIVGSIRSGEDFSRVEKALFLCVLAVMSLTVINYLSGGLIGGDKVRGKWIPSGVLTGPYMSPANFSFFISTIAIYSIGSYMYSKKTKYAIIYLMLSIVVFAAFTRISMAGLVVATGVCIFFMTSNKLYKYVVPAFIVISFIIMLFTVDKFRDRMFFNADKFSLSEAVENPDKLEKNFDTSGRLYLWTKVLAHFESSNKYVGNGIGSVDSLLAKEFNSLRLHSEYLRLYIDLGLIGLILYLLGLAQIVYRIYSYTKHEYTKPYSSIALGVIACYMITLFTDNSLNYVTEFGNYVYAFVGLAVASKIYNKTPNVKDYDDKVEKKELKEFKSVRLRT